MVVQDSKGKKLNSGRVDNSTAAVAAFLEPFAGDRSHAVLEATRNWTVMYDLLEAHCDEVLLANQPRVKAIAEAKIKTDMLARLNRRTKRYSKSIRMLRYALELWTLKDFSLSIVDNANSVAMLTARLPGAAGK